jgi:CBS domain-containing protein
VKSPTIYTSKSISEAIDSMQADSDRGVVVVDDSENVVGILTEGDIVRAVRGGTLMEAKVSSITTGRVRSVTVPLDDSELVAEFVAHGTLLIPVVDFQRKFLYVQRTREAVSRLLSQHA